MHDMNTVIIMHVRSALVHVPDVSGVHLQHDIALAAIKTTRISDQHCLCWVPSLPELWLLSKAGDGLVASHFHRHNTFYRLQLHLQYIGVKVAHVRIRLCVCEEV